MRKIRNAGHYVDVMVGAFDSSTKIGKSLESPRVRAICGNHYKRFVEGDGFSSAELARVLYGLANSGSYFSRENVERELSVVGGRK